MTGFNLFILLICLLASLSRFINAVHVNYVCLQFGDRDPVLIIAPRHGEKMHINVSEDLQKLGVSWAFSINPNDPAYRGVEITNELCKKLRMRDENHTESSATLDSKCCESSNSSTTDKSQSHFGNSVDTVESVHSERL